MVETPRDKTGGLGVDFRWDTWKFSSDLFLLFAYSSTVVHSAANKSKYQGIFLAVNAAGA
jgi:hypothetical protein